MIPELRRIFDYHDWATDQVLAAAETCSEADLRREIGGSFPSVLTTLAHIARVEWLFIRRWKELATADVVAACLDSAGQVSATLRAVRAERREFLLPLDRDALGRSISYTDTRGRAVTLQVWEAVFQCINHSTFHRGQIVEKLRHLGMVPPATDFVLFCRGLDR